MNFDEGLEAWVEIRHTEIDQLGQFRKELLVEGFVGGFGKIGFTLGAREFGGILVRLFDEFLYFGAGGVIIEEFMVAFFNACVVTVSMPVLELLSGRRLDDCRFYAMAVKIEGCMSAGWSSHSLISGK